MSEGKWVYYAFKGTPLMLDPRRYRRFKREDGTYTVPEWACVAPNGGFHRRREFKRLDVHLQCEPKPYQEFSATKLSVKLVRTSWFDLFSDGIPEESYLLGDVIVDGRILQEWRTITTRRTPRLRASKEGLTGTCQACGDEWRVLQGNDLRLDERDRSGDMIFATNRGLFIDYGLVKEKAVPAPRGCFKPPDVVRFGRNAA